MPHFPLFANQANWRHLQFGIDDDRASAWRDCGRPGNATLAFALSVHEGALYAGTCEPGKNESGRVYRYGGGDLWIDCGAPDTSNSVTALAVHHGKLYAGTGKYRLGGSSLKESENTTLGGRVFRYEGGTRWVDCGQLPETEAVGGLVVFKDQLYASSLFKPAGFFRYEGDARWTSLPVPQGPDLKTQETDQSAWRHCPCMTDSSTPAATTAAMCIALMAKRGPTAARSATSTRSTRGSTTMTFAGCRAWQPRRQGVSARCRRCR